MNGSEKFEIENVLIKKCDEIRSRFNRTHISNTIIYGYKQKVNIAMYHDAKIMIYLKIIELGREEEVLRC